MKVLKTWKQVAVVHEYQSEFDKTLSNVVKVYDEMNETIQNP